MPFLLPQPSLRKAGRDLQEERAFCSVQLFPERPFRSQFIRAWDFMMLPRGVPGLLPVVFIKPFSCLTHTHNISDHGLGIYCKVSHLSRVNQESPGKFSSDWELLFYSQMAFAFSIRKKHQRGGSGDCVKDAKINTSLGVSPCPKPQLWAAKKEDICFPLERLQWVCEADIYIYIDVLSMERGKTLPTKQNENAGFIYPDRGARSKSKLQARGQFDTQKGVTSNILEVILATLHHCKSPGCHQYSGSQALLGPGQLNS